MSFGLISDEIKHKVRGEFMMHPEIVDYFYQKHYAENKTSFDNYYGSLKSETRTISQLMNDVKPGFLDKIMDKKGGIWRDMITFVHLEKTFRQLDIYRTSDDVDEIVKGLRILSPSEGALPTQLLAGAFTYRYETAQFKKSHPEHVFNKPHSATFGTGGDKNHTLNMSTIAMIYAAAFSEYEGKEDLFVKIGTGPVTGRHGGARMAKMLLEIIRKPENFEAVALADIGYEYRTPFVSARKIIASMVRQTRNGEVPFIDPVKIMAPGAGMSGAKTLATGYRSDFLPHLIPISKKITTIDKSSQALYSSSDGSDEIMPGKNDIRIYNEGELTKRYTYTGSDDARLVRDLTYGLRERELEKDQLDASLVLMGLREGTVADQQNWNLAMNAATMLPEYHHSEDPHRAHPRIAMRIKPFIEEVQQNKGKTRDDKFTFIR